MALALLLLGALVACVPGVPTWGALLAGLLIGLGPGNPARKTTSKVARISLGVCVAALGPGVQLSVITTAGLTGVLITLVSIAITMSVGLAAGRALGVKPATATLISAGTAICGGSAIAAVAPVIQADDDDVAVSAAIVFLLNAVGLVLFPALGHLLALDEPTFGRWAALAIHDTSSVVGASAAYGATALAVGTTTKLVRALYIGPLTWWLARRSQTRAGASVPWFLPVFFGSAVLVALVPALAGPGATLAGLAKHGLGAPIFLIGAGVDRSSLRSAGGSAAALGMGLWLLASIVGLGLAQL